MIEQDKASVGKQNKVSDIHLDSTNTWIRQAYPSLNDLLNSGFAIQICEFLTCTFMESSSMPTKSFPINKFSNKTLLDS